MKKIKRSWLRLICGRGYYTLRRYWDWHFSGKQFAKERGVLEEYPLVIFRHQTPLIRNLPQAELWLQRNKITNLQIALARLDGILLRPGETFSYWRLIGKPTKAKGYLAGMVLYNGQIKAGIGGGLCQLSNLIYWMTLHTPLNVNERWRHSYDVFPDEKRTVPFGSGATCAYPFLDLQITNHTEETWQLHLYLTETELVGEWRARRAADYHYQIYEAEHRITHELGGYVRQNVLRRKVFDQEGQLVNDELIAVNRALMMYQPYLGG